MDTNPSEMNPRATRTQPEQPQRYKPRACQNPALTKLAELPKLRTHQASRTHLAMEPRHDKAKQDKPDGQEPSDMNHAQLQNSPCQEPPMTRTPERPTQPALQPERAWKSRTTPKQRTHHGLEPRAIQPSELNPSTRTPVRQEPPDARTRRSPLASTTPPPGKIPAQHQ